MERESQSRGAERPRRSVETEPSGETGSADIPFAILHSDLRNYSEHLRDIESSSLSIVDGVVRSAKLGFTVSLVLNVISFILGLAIIVVGLIALVRAPEQFGRIVGLVSSIIGLALVVTLLFWKGPLERIITSVAHLACINVVTIGLAFRLNQVSRLFVQESLRGTMTPALLEQLDRIIGQAVRQAVDDLQVVLPTESAEEQAGQLLLPSADSDHVQELGPTPHSDGMQVPPLPARGHM